MPQPVRAIFISDCHLGQKLARGDELLAFLRAYQPDRVYLVGDFIDTWCLRWNWLWPASYAGILERLIDLRARGAEIFYTPGNHDAVLRRPLPHIAGLTIANQFVHQLQDGRRLLVIHGDLLDSIEHGWKWLSRIGSFCFNRVIDLNMATNRILRAVRLPPIYYSFWIKRSSKRLLGAFGRFQRKLIQTAADRGLDGIICGHVHWPLMIDSEGVLYVNTGDWLENASALIEHIDGSLELRNHGQIIGQRSVNSATRASSPATSSSETT